MVGSVVSVATGVMNPLIGKLTALMGDEYKKLTGVRRQALFLEKEFSAMNAALHKLELMDELDSAVKDWINHVREMSYDMENCIDDFMRQFGREDAKAGFVKKTTRHLKKLRQRHRIAARIEELKILAVDANARRERYKIDDWKPSSGSVTVDPRLRAVYQEAASLVGIDGPMEELASWLTDTQEKLKVLSIVGFGGLGKTTLAKQLYYKFRGQFHCEAFFSVSQKPDIKVLLNRLEAKLHMTQSSHAREIEDIIEDIRKHLKEKRYLIVVDDLWDQSVWNVISRAFPNEGNGSRVIMTTRVYGVASTASHNDHECIYRMKPLDERNSRMLFCDRIFGSGDGCPSYLEEVSADILKKCGGLPLAIITIASLLASQEGSRSGWENIRSSLGARSTIHPTLEDVKNILNLSYMHLPLHLRACFLYLGMYPEDEEIVMSVVIREWVAEGLVSNLHGSDLMDVAESYFSELINRSMIQPGRTENGILVSCRIHDIMLDLILRKCTEDNFLSVASTSEDITRLQGCKYKVRRLSLRSMAGGATNGLAINARLLSQVRSCALARKSMPSLLLFKYLRVLTLHGGYKDLTIDLTGINQLFQLRYLRVEASRGGIELPCALKGLVYLETLDLNCDLENSFPSDIVHLPCLSYLCLPSGAIQGVQNMKSLRTLRWFDLDKNSVNDIRGLGKLTNLRELELGGCDVETSKIDALVSSVGKLHNLKYLHISTNLVTDESNQLGLLSSSPFKHIEILELWHWEFPRVPEWMGDLHCLRVLYLRAMETSAEDVHVLGKLPSLIWLNFRVTRMAAAEQAVFGKGAFPVLQQLAFWPSKGDVTAFLVLEVNERGGSTPVGMQHLILLETIRLHVPSDAELLSSSWTKDDVVSAFGEALELHPNHPYILLWIETCLVLQPCPKSLFCQGEGAQLSATATPPFPVNRRTADGGAAHRSVSRPVPSQGAATVLSPVSIWTNRPEGTTKRGGAAHRRPGSSTPSGHALLDVKQEAGSVRLQEQEVAQDAENIPSARAAASAVPPRRADVPAIRARRLGRPPAIGRLRGERLVTRFLHTVVGGFGSSIEFSSNVSKIFRGRFPRKVKIDRMFGRVCGVEIMKEENVVSARNGWAKFALCAGDTLLFTILAEN